MTTIQILSQLAGGAVGIAIGLAILQIRHRREMRRLDAQIRALKDEARR